MNGRFRKASALIATVALVTGAVAAALVAPASASTQTACEGPPPSSNGCTIGGESATTSNLTPGEALGVQFTLTEPGTIFQACYPPDLTDGDSASDPISVYQGATLIAGPTNASGGCVTFNLLNQPAGTYTVSYVDPVAHYNDGGNPPPTTVGDVTGIVPTVNGAANPGLGFGVSVRFYSNPNAPAPVSLTPTGNTTATFAFTGDGAQAPFGGTMFWNCSASVGTVTPASGSVATTGSSSIPLSGMTSSPSNQITCNVHEQYGSSVGPTATASSYLLPPAPTGVTVTPSTLTSVKVSFTGDGVVGATFTATCTSSAGGGTHTGTGTSSPITVGGFTNVSSQVITCTVKETWPAPASTTSVVSSSGSTALIGQSGPGCTGTVTAPTQLSAASMAFPGAVVSWAPVVPDPASCLSGYLVTPIDGSTKLPASFVSAGNTTTHVLGLTLGHSYTFTVAAVAGKNVSPDSDPIGPVTIGTPAAVTSVHVAHVGKGAVKVAFKAGSSNGAAITKFIAACGSKTASGTSSPLVVRGLKAGKTYICTVRARNSRGVGAAARSAAVKA